MLEKIDNTLSALGVGAVATELTDSALGKQLIEAATRIIRCREDLVRLADQIAGDVQRVKARVETCDLPLVNRLGELHSTGRGYDQACAELSFAIQQGKSLAALYEAR